MTTDSIDQVDREELTALLAESEGIDSGTLEEEAERLEIEDPEDADWEYLE